MGTLEDLAADPVWDAAKNTLSFELAEGLKSGSRYEVQLTGLLGGSLRLQDKGDFRWRFNTVVPAIDSLTPAAVAGGIGITDASIQVFFDHPLDAGEIGLENVQD